LITAIVLISKGLRDLQRGNQLLAKNKSNHKIKEYCIMQVIEKNVLFSQVSVEESAIFSGGNGNSTPPGSYNFIGLLTYIGLGTLIWALDEALLPGA
jgi:hypothetical protein